MLASREYNSGSHFAAGFRLTSQKFATAASDSMDWKGLFQTRRVVLQLSCARQLLTVWTVALRLSHTYLCPTPDRCVGGCCHRG